jgi:nitroimidazol reductase NimA-like FMN-containing flavoprotein (pyridoxamine 5'-phosphate oxidase superfamily)
MSNGVELVKHVIDRNTVMVIATTDDNGLPWISPVFFNYDTNYNFYWTSYRQTLHASYLRTRPKVALVIIGTAEDGGGNFGIYIKAEAHELSDQAIISSAIPVMQQRPQEEKYIIKTIDDVTGTSPWRIYKAEPKELSCSADSQIGGYSGTLREAINFTEMIKH